MIKAKDGDILTATEDCICHQVNTKGVMGAGVAKAICGKYPVVKTEYIKFCKANKDLLGRVNAVRASEHQIVLNIFGQEDYGRDPRRVYTDYDALRRAFKFIWENFGGRSLAFPYKFGCGLANGDWDIVYGMIADQFQYSDMSVTIYNK
jgi:O-acetyl-ADP-ribose deacetylase (regulator of RNase III)